MAMALAASMLLPPPRPRTKSQPFSRAKAAPAMTVSTTGLAETLSNTAYSTPAWVSWSWTASRYPLARVDLPLEITMRAFLPGRRCLCSF